MHKYISIFDVLKVCVPWLNDINEMAHINQASAAYGALSFILHPILFYLGMEPAA